MGHFKRVTDVTASLSSPDSSMCLVCGSPESEPHFGGNSCRACAAFFRRYFHSKKSLPAKCNCKDRTVKSHPCRKCRIEKCLKIGMTANKIQNCRDKNAMEIEILKNVQSTSLSATRIVSRSTSLLEFATPCWREFEKLRYKNSCIEMEGYNFYTVTSLTKMDMDLSWDMTKKMFPSVTDLKECDKEALLRNFILKFWQIIPLFEEMNDIENGGKEYDKMVVSWYSGSFEEGKEMSEKEIIRVFKPFWEEYLAKFTLPIAGLKLKNEELMAIVWLLFFDSAYTNISPECQEVCRNIRKVILRELKNFQTEKDLHEMRLFDTLDVLKLIEKSEEKFMMEMMICEMHHLRIHEDFKAILKENRF